MRTPKHTPGPWHICDNDGAYCMVRGQPANGYNGASIAKVWLQDGDFNDENARLIAAAPELLEALVVAQQQIAALKRRIVWHDCDSVNVVTANERTISAAIAKATGDTNIK